MNRTFLFSSILLLTFSLFGCQHLPSIDMQPTTKVKTNKLKSLLMFGANFAIDFNSNPKYTCAKYIRLHQEGDWRASWVLALTANKTNSEQCLNSEDAIQILTTLEAQKKIYPELLWLNQFHLQLLNKLQEKTEKVTRLHDTIDSSQKQSKNQRLSRAEMKQQLIDLKKENQVLTEKLEALKNIETSIINTE